MGLVLRHFDSEYIRALLCACANIIFRKYKSISPTIPSGQRHFVFLDVTEDVIDSVLSSEMPTLDSKMWRPDAPFVVAVSETSDSGLEEGHEENEWFKESFKVAIEVLIEDFWIIIDDDMMSLRRSTRFLGDDEIWWSSLPSPERMAKRRRIRYG